jgi:hypothetical protein
MAKKRKPKSLLKAVFLEYWAAMKRRRKIKPRAIPYKYKGSTFDQDGIRITGSRRFVDSVLSHLTSLLAYENDMTLLKVSYRQITDKESGQPIDGWQCYIQVQNRGEQAQMVNAWMNAVTGKGTEEDASA